jgi:predicted ATPase
VRSDNGCPITVLGTIQTNLPVQLTSFVGRQRELDELTALLGDVRLLTLVGTGGIGKTRLALQLADVFTRTSLDGVWLVELASLEDQALVPRTIAASLGISERSTEPHETILTEELLDRRLLLVIDNCEHVLEGCARLFERLLRACAGLRILATSRQPLGVPGETTWRVAPLAVPLSSGASSADEIAASEAARLFVERSRAVLPRFAIDEHNAPSIAQVCDRLEGIPLALELAAARVGHLSIEQIAARLDDRLALLSAAPSTAPRRHQTLRRTIDWSVELLTPNERTLLRRVAVFAGGWSLEAAEEVCAAPPVARDQVLALLGRLVDRSLVIAEVGGSEARYRLLETVRQYALESLADQQSTADLHRRHADFFLALAQRGAPQLVGPAQGPWLERLEREHDNLRAAMRWAIGAEGPCGETALRMAASLSPMFWQIRGHRREGLEWVTAALAKHGSAPAAIRAAALRAAGLQAFNVGEFDRATSFLEASLELDRSLGQKPGGAPAMHVQGEVAEIPLARIAQLQGSYQRAIMFASRAIERGQQLGDTTIEPYACWILGQSRLSEGDFLRARTALEQGVNAARRVGDEHLGAHCRTVLGAVMRHQGSGASARRLHEDSRVVFERLGDSEGIASSLFEVAALALEQGEVTAASDGFRRALTLQWEVRFQPHIPPSIEALAKVAAARG